MTEEQAIEGLTQLTLQELKRKPAAEILALAESLEIEGANTLRTQDMLFAILKQVAERGVEIGGAGVCEQAGSCMTFPMWQHLDELIDSYLERITLEDLLNGNV